MNLPRLTEEFVYLLLVVLVLVAVVLVVASPTEFTQTDLVYKGF